MNIIQAVKSGLPFKRKTEVYYRQPGDVHTLSREELEAEDYEIKIQMIGLNKAQVEDIYFRGVAAYPVASRAEINRLLDVLLQELGFK